MLISSFKKKAWAYSLNVLNFNWKLRSNLIVQIRNYGDWTIYNEIFVNNEYDLAILDFINTIDNSRTTVNILDVGANVGFFTMRFCDLLTQKRIDPKRLNFVLTEADKRCISQLESNLSQLLNFGVSYKIYHGLAGKLNGESLVNFGKETFGTTAINNRTDSSLNGSNRSKLGYININELIKNNNHFDLIKCDIEGSEFDFINSYQNLISKAESFIVEFHSDFGIIADAEKLINKCGMCFKAVLGEEFSFMTKYFMRDNTFYNNDKTISS